jgi:hypothetical protein
MKESVLYYKCLSNNAVGDELPKISSKFYPGYIYLSNNVPYIVTCSVPTLNDFDACIKCRQGHVVWKELQQDSETEMLKLRVIPTSNVKYDGEITEYPHSNSQLTDLLDISSEFYTVLNAGGDLTEFKKVLLSLEIEQIETFLGKKMTDTLKEEFPKMVKKLSEMVSIMVFNKWISED